MSLKLFISSINIKGKGKYLILNVIDLKEDVG
jgi:hypothetical protein